jgi:hypothetical protein
VSRSADAALSVFIGRVCTPLRWIECCCPQARVAARARAGTEAFAVARKTAEFLSDQSELLKVQKKIAEAELRLRTGFQIFIALFATVIGIAIAI